MAQLQREPTGRFAVPYSLGRRVSPTTGAAFVLGGANAELARDGRVTPLRVRAALMGESLR